MNANVYYKSLINKHSSFGYYIKPKEKEITILIPCWGKANYIEETVKSCVNQTMKAYQIIVLLMDQESQKLKDKLENLADNVKCIIHERLLISAARNYLVKICPTEYFFLLDADDTVSSNALEECYKQKESIVQISRDDCGRIVGACKQISMINLTGLWNKEIWNELGGLNEEINFFEDVEFKLRVLEQKKWDVGFAYKANYNYTKDAENNSAIIIGNKINECGYKAFNNKNFIYYPNTFNYDCNDLDNFLIILKENNIDIRNIRFDFSEDRKTSNKQKSIKIFFSEKESDYQKYLEIIENKILCAAKSIKKINSINIILGNNATKWPIFFQEKIYNLLKKYNFGIIYVETDGKNKDCVFYHRNDIILIRDYYIDWDRNTNFDDLQKNEIPRLTITNDNINEFETLLQKNNLIYFDCKIDFTNKSLVNKLIELKKKYKKITIKSQCTGDKLIVDL